MYNFKTLITILAIMVFSYGCSYVKPGHVGVKVYLLGGEKGVDTEELPVGRYWIGINEELHLFPTFTQNYVWTMDSNEGSKNDESFKFQTVGGLVVGADIGISYAIDPTKATSIFQKYRKGVDEITDIYLRNMVRDALVKVAGDKKIDYVYGIGKADLIEAVEKRVRDEVAEIGIIIEKVYWIGELRLPKIVVDAINNKIKATQKTGQRQNEVAQVIAEADKVREKAKGDADAILLVATAEAAAIKIKGDALKNSPDVVKLNAIDKWNGVLPRFTGGGAVPFIDISSQLARK